LTIIVLWRWLIATGQPEWLALAYAWNPLVVLEVAHSGHIDALGALWIAASAYWLARRRTALASIAFVLAVATKLLPIVLAPLYWRRVRLRDALAAGAFLALLYVTFTKGGALALGTVPSVVQHIRFNGPFFRWIGRATSPQAAAVFAVALGTLVAIWARWRLSAANPAAWAWPMGAALLWAPVIYPWYLLYLTPFLLTTSTLPLIVWTLAVIPTYVVWEMVKQGAPWAVPSTLMFAEYAIFFASAAAVAAFARRARRTPNPAEPSRTP
jgi:alpha-1,6-mannosyltransferase